MQGLEALEAYRVKIPASVQAESSSTSAPGQNGFFYIPNFLTEHEESYILDKISTAPQPKWKYLQNRRLQYWGGSLSSKNTLIPEPLPDFMTRFPTLISRIAQTGAFHGSIHGQPNHCLVNEYLPGQGILPHEDGDAYFHSVATVSCGSHTVLDIYRWATQDEGKIKAREQEPIFSILQEPRSLLVTVGDAYCTFLHGIAERTRDEAKQLTRVVNVNQLVDEKVKNLVVRAIQAPDPSAIDDVLVREDRISLTFRDVEKVSKGLGGLLRR